MAKKAKAEKVENNSNLIFADTFLSKPVRILRVSPAFDIGLGGGIPEGSWVVLTGRPKFGKSSAAMHMISQYLTQFPEGKALYVDVETRLKEINLRNRFLDPTRLQIMRSTQDDIIHAEDFLERTETYIKENPNCIVVIDSVSSLCSTTEYIDSVKGNTRSLGPKLMANFTRKMAPLVPVQNAIIILITHQIANTSGYGSPFSEDGGNKIQYQSDIKMKCKTKTEWIEDERNIGQQSNWLVEWSALGPPGMEVSSYFRYNYGLDAGMELANLGLDFGLITKSGAWYQITCLLLSEDQEIQDMIDPKKKEKSFTFQGLQKVGDFINSNDKVQKFIMKELVSML